MIKPILFGCCVSASVFVSVLMLIVAWRIILPLIGLTALYLILREFIAMAKDLEDKHD